MIMWLSVIRSQPVNTFDWGNDTTISVRFNPGEPNVLATSAKYVLRLASISNIMWMAKWISN